MVKAGVLLKRKEIERRGTTQLAPTHKCSSWTWCASNDVIVLRGFFGANTQQLISNILICVLLLLLLLLLRYFFSAFSSCSSSQPLLSFFPCFITVDAFQPPVLTYADSFVPPSPILLPILPPTSLPWSSLTSTPKPIRFTFTLLFRTTIRHTQQQTYYI